MIYLFSVKKSVPEINQLQRQLDDEYLAVFNEVTAYLRSCSLPKKDIDRLLQAILNNWLLSQNQGQKVVTTIGGNYKRFCDEQIAAYLQDRQNKDRWNLGANLLLTLFILIAIDFGLKNLVGNLIQGKPINLQYTATLNFMILWIFALVAVWYIFRSIKRQTWIEKPATGKSERIISGLIMVSPFVLVLVSKRLQLNQMAVFSCNGLALLILVLLLSLGCRWRSNQ